MKPKFFNDDPFLAYARHQAEPVPRARVRKALRAIRALLLIVAALGGALVIADGRLFGPAVELARVVQWP